MRRALKLVSQGAVVSTQTERSLATAWIVQGYHTVLSWVVAYSTDVVRPLQSTGRRSCCTCDGQRTSPCRLSGVGEHWHQRRAGSRRLDKQVRGRSDTGIPRRQSWNWQAVVLVTSGAIYTMSQKKGTDSTLGITLTNSNSIFVIFARNVMKVMRNY